jgi:membrane associated rhomboid family serine protease
MFVPIPLEMKPPNERSSFPLANAVLILINILVWLFGWQWMVGPGTGVFSIVGYAFCHYSFWQVFLNMWVLWVFGKPLNRRLGNVVYVLVYLGCVVAVGLFARLLLSVGLIGSSGAIFGVMAMALILMPSTVIDVAYLAFFPLTVLIALFKRPKYELNWILSWGIASVPALWCLVMIPLLEILSLIWRACYGGWCWAPASHLLGMVIGVILVLLLPSRISMRRGSLADAF